MNKKFYMMVLSAFLLAGFFSCKQPGTAEAGSNAGAANMEMVKHVYDLMNGSKMDSLDTYIASDFLDHNPDPMQKSSGLAGLKEAMKAWMTSSPDSKMNITSMMADGDLVMVHSVVSGINTGPMMPGMPPSNKAWKVDMFEKLKIKDGKCVERWGVFDAMSMMMQCGMMPGQATADASMTKQEAPAEKK